MTERKSFFNFEQVAIRSNNVKEHATTLGRKFGAAPWIFDTVDAVHLFAAARENLGGSFQVDLAFNYTLLPDKELELIALRSGRTVQLWDSDPGCAMCTERYPAPEDISGPIGPQVMSHLGYHLEDVEGVEAQEAQLLAMLQWWIGQGYPVVQLSQTVIHTGTKRRYRYAFADTRPVLGVWTKIIQRMNQVADEASIARGREAFKWLADQF
jgi:hypothetical protein